MITWSNDANLDKICIDINKYISTYKMKNYFIYGLQGQERPHVRIAPKVTPVLMDLFKQSNYLLETKAVPERYCSDCDSKHWHGECCCDTLAGCELCFEDNITIGLRRDIRSNVIMSRKLIKTIIFGLEDKLELSSTSKLNLGRRVRKKILLPKVGNNHVKGKGLGPCGCSNPNTCPTGNLDLSATAIGRLPSTIREDVARLTVDLNAGVSPSRMGRIIHQIQEIIGVR